MRRFFTLAIVFVCSTLVAPTPIEAGATRERWPICGQWREVPVPGDDLYPGGLGYVRDVDVVSPAEAWAVSDYGYEVWNEAHVYRWGGLRWEEVPFPTPDTGPDYEYWALDDIEAISATDVWVVGYKLRIGSGVSRPIVGRWNGSRWRLVPLGLRHVYGQLAGIVSVPGTDDLVAVGTRSPRRPSPIDRDEEALILRWNGSRWQRIRGTDPGRWSELVDVVLAGSVVWAVGTGLRRGEAAPHLLAFRWTRRGWAPRWGPRGHVTSADAVAPDEIWAAGWTPTAGGGGGMLARWNGRAWTIAHRFDRVDVLSDVVAPAPGDVWAVGSTFVRKWNLPRGYIVHGGGGIWRIDWRSDDHGDVTAIDGTPHNLWTFFTYPPVEAAEVWRFTSLHRC